MGFFYLIQQHHRVGMFGNRIGEQPALVKTNVARGRANQARDRMALHVFGHVKPDQLKAQLQGELFGDLGFAHSGGAREQKRANGLVARAQTGPCQLY